MNDKKSFVIVAIGASAGGIEAVTELLKNLPSNTGMAFVYIQHLDPTHESMLSTILARATKMKVVEAENMLKIEPTQPGYGYCRWGAYFKPKKRKTYVTFAC